MQKDQIYNFINSLLCAYHGIDIMYDFSQNFYC